MLILDSPSPLSLSSAPSHSLQAGSGGRSARSQLCLCRLRLLFGNTACKTQMTETPDERTQSTGLPPVCLDSDHDRNGKDMSMITASGTGRSNQGVVASVRGSVVDVRFEDSLPPIYS